MERKERKRTKSQISKPAFKVLLTALLVMAAAMSCTAPADRESAEAQAAYRVLERTFGHRPSNVVFSLTDKAESECGRYSTESRGGKLYVSGSSPVAMTKGFYDYIVTNGYGIASWTGNRLELPRRFPERGVKEVVSPFRDHLYYNVCTFGYTMPYWGWEEWERELDWIAMHGFDMVLAPVAGEAILARVWRGLGLTDEETGEYFTAPGHMPWMRMGNMSGLDGPPSQEWHEGQIELQHKILDRMEELGIKPVFQGFAGFVPQAMKSRYPDAVFTHMTWCGFDSWILSPLDGLFTVIGDGYIREWEKEFGKGQYYLIDSFNEMDFPFGEKGSRERRDNLRRYSEILYGSISGANPDAVWVMQGWMFGYQRHIWDPESVEALLSGAPDGKLMIIDLAVDFNHYVWRSEKSWDHFDGFNGKEWIFSTVPNFGGRSALTGALDFYMNGHLEAVNSPARGNLTGYGTSPEGIENNEAVYEIISDSGWRGTAADTREFLHRYSAARYGECPPAIDTFWSAMMRSSYGTFTQQARHKWQMRPMWARFPRMGINEEFFAAIESFLSCADEMKKSELYRTDALQYAAFYLAAKADIMLDAVNWAYVAGDTEAAQAHEARFLELLREADRLLESHPLLRAQRWIDFARARGGSSGAEADNFEKNARRLISVWGGPVLHDYSARIWSGVIRDFYIPRWEQYFSLKKSPAQFDFAAYDELWVERKGLSPVDKYPDGEVLGRARGLVGEARTITPSITGASADAVCFWSPFEFDKERITITTAIERKWFPYVKGVRFVAKGGTESVEIVSVRFAANRQTLGYASGGVKVGPRNETALLPVNVTVPDALPAEVTMYLELQGRVNSDSYVSVELDFGGERPFEGRVNF